MPYKDPDAQRKYQREWRAQRRADFFEGKSCVSCGSTEDLELDHIDTGEKVSHKIWSWSEVRRLAELLKCQVLCKDCHLEKSAAEKAKGERVTGSKLTEEQVHEIRTRANTESKRSLAREFGIDEGSIRALVARRTWKHV